MNEYQWLASSNPYEMLSWYHKNNNSIGNRKLRLFTCACARLVWDKLTDRRSHRAVHTAEKYADGETTVSDVALNFLAAPATIPPPPFYVRAKFEESDLAWMTCFTNQHDIPVESFFHYGHPNHLDCMAANLLREIIGNPFRPISFHDSWRTPTVMNLALTAYQERIGIKCNVCDGNGHVPIYGPSKVYKHCGKPTCERGDIGRILGGYLPRQCSVCHTSFPARQLFNEKCQYCYGDGRHVTAGKLEPDRLAVLADALEDAGCDNEELIRHLRSYETCLYCMLPTPEEAEYGGGNYWCPGCDGSEAGNPHATWMPIRSDHVRGCWALDTILGKQ